MLSRKLTSKLCENYFQIKLENFVTIPDGITLLDKNIISGISMYEKVANIIINKYPNKYKFVNAFNVDVSETSMYVIAKR